MDFRLPSFLCLFWMATFAVRRLLGPKDAWDWKFRIRLHCNNCITKIKCCYRGFASHLVNIQVNQYPSLSNFRFCQSATHAPPEFVKTIFLSLVFSPALLVLDHIHFQYNGPLFSILVYSLYLAPTAPLFSAFMFATLLCFKHIYLYLAPAYFFYLLRSYCLTPTWRPQLVNAVKLGGVVLGPFVLAFGPFLMFGQLGTVMKRLFPFQRGLCHAYWAPNFWALYSFGDRIAIQGSPTYLVITKIQSGQF